MEYKLNDFMEEIKAEMAGYEEISDEAIIAWEVRAKQWINTHIDKKNRIIKKNNSILIQVKDEADIFIVVDKYLAAIMHEELEHYWNGFTLF